MPAEGASWPATFRRAVGQRDMNAAIAAHERFLQGRGTGRLVMRFAEALELDCGRRLLNEADFTGAHLQGSTFAGTHLERAALYCADLRGCDLRACNLRRADLRGASLAGATLNGAVLDEADMRAASLLVADSSGGYHDIAVLSGRPKRKSPHDGADFTNCSMKGASLRESNLKGADFSGAILEGADLSGAKLTDALFHEAVLTGVHLDTLRLSRDQLRGCVLDPTDEAMQRVEALRAVLEAAAEWVESGGRRGARPVLDGEDLRPLAGSFRGRVLTALSARRAVAIGIDFSGCELQGANFDGADLRGATFDNADLRGASFRQARLSHAQFRAADTSPLRLPDRRLHATSFVGASLHRAVFDEGAVPRGPEAAARAAG